MIKVPELALPTSATAPSFTCVSMHEQYDTMHLADWSLWKVWWKINFCL